MSDNISAIAERLYDDRNIIKSQNIDVDKYLKGTDLSAQVKSAATWLDEIYQNYIDPEQTADAVMPWSKTHADVKFRLGEVTVYAGGNGGGKSLVTGQIALGLIKQDKKVCIASYEMKPVTTIVRMLRQFAGENISVPLTHDKEGYIRGLLGRFTGFIDENLYLYDQQGSTTAQKTIAMARYCAVELGIQHIFIDSLMKCVSGEDALNEQKSFVDELCALARDHNVHIHLVHHIRKLQSEEIQPGKTDLKGSGSIADQVDNVFLVWRNKKKENARRNNEDYDEKQPDMFLMCQKQRNGEAEEFYGLYFEHNSQQFIEVQGGQPIDFDNRGAFRA
jgi:twinkle protein